MSQRTITIQILQIEGQKPIETITKTWCEIETIAPTQITSQQHD